MKGARGTKAHPDQTRGIAIPLSYAGCTTREHRLRIVSRLVGRDVTSTKDLTRAEADSIITHLRNLDAIGELGLLVEQYRED